MYKNQCMINSMIQYSIEDNAEILFLSVERIHCEIVEY